jgi:glycosyltransferase involved in cell wall biosynthesis
MTLNLGSEVIMSKSNFTNLAVFVLNNHCHAQGGASRVAIDEAIGLAARGLNVTFLGAVGPVCDELGAASVRVICLGQEELSSGRASAALQGLWNVPAAKKLGELLESQNPKSTIVHLHGFTQALSTSPVRSALSRRFAVIYTMHDFFSACPNGTFFDFASREPCYRHPLSLSCITRNCDKRNYSHKVYRVARSVVQKWFGGLPSGVKDYVGLSQRSIDILRKYLPQDAHIHALQNPIDVARKLPVNAAANSTVLAVGRLDPEKGIDVLVEAAKRSNVRLTLVGDGPLRQMAEASGVCRVTGWISAAGVEAELERARCLVFPSLWYETYGLVVDEAAARGIPAIVSGISAAAERVENEVTGWHVRAGDVESLSRRLIAIGDDSAISSAGRAAYNKFWARPPTRDLHIDGLIAIYRGMLDRRLEDVK